jgi:hypothetical protein
VNIKKKDIANYIRQYSNYLDSINGHAYQDVFMLSNVTLSKNPYTGSTFLQNLILNKEVHASNRLFCKHAILFYLKNIVYLLLWAITFFYTKLFITKKYSNPQKGAILIDTFFGKSQINADYQLKDPFFNGLYQFLDEHQIHYCVLPNIFGSNRNPIEMIGIVRFLSKMAKENLTEFDLLSLMDIIRIINFILLYPFKVKGLINSVDGGEKVDHLFKFDLCVTLSKTSFFSYVKYLFGKQLKTLFSDKEVKLISWCEYQTIDKNLYKGIKNNNIHIYGCQFLLKYPTLCSSYIPESDKKFAITPDTILVNGNYYVPDESNFQYEVGPAFRYKHVTEFNRNKISNKSNAILVMLSYVQEDAFHIINVLKKSPQFKEKSIDFKIHPDFAHEKNKYESLLEKNWRLIDDIKKLDAYGIVISSNSGSVLEFASIGMSVIIIASNGAFTTNPMPEEGKGIIWDIAYDEDELKMIYQNLQEIRSQKFSDVQNISEYYLKDFFSPVTLEAIIENFDLKEWIHLDFRDADNR